MASKYQQKFPIPNGFPQILHDFAKEILRDQPADILDYGCAYFKALEEGTDFDYPNKGANIPPPRKKKIGGQRSQNEPVVVEEKDALKIAENYLTDLGKTTSDRLVKSLSQGSLHEELQNAKHKKSEDDEENSPKRKPDAGGKKFEEDEKEREKRKEKEREAEKKDHGLAGGHVSNFKFLPDGTLLKRTSKAEIAYFNEINDPSCKYYRERKAADKFMPKFHGTEAIDGEEWIKMENVNFGLTHPSYIDVKMGTQTYAPDYPEKKKLRHMEADKNTTTPTLGLKVSGMVLKNMTFIIYHR